MLTILWRQHFWCMFRPGNEINGRKEKNRISCACFAHGTKEIYTKELYGNVAPENIPIATIIPGGTFATTSICTLSGHLRTGKCASAPCEAEMCAHFL